MATVFSEIRRRNVFKVAVAYAVVAWLSAQIISVVHVPLHLPDWFGTAIIVFLVAGFPIAILFAWAYELTPEGLKPTHTLDRSASIAHLTGRKLDFLIIGVLVLAVGVLVIDNYVLVDESESVTVEPTQQLEPVSDDPEVDAEKSIAVLPFVNMSADPDQEYFSDGISEEILHALVGVPNLRVAARTSAFSFKGKDVDIRAVGDTLNVNHVLEGSVRKADNRVRITAQLIQVEDGFHLWSETYERELNDIFAIQEEIAQAVVEKLEVALGLDGEVPLVKTGTANTEAYNWYLRGRYGIEQQSPEGFQDAIESFTKAIELDPDFAGGHGGLAYVSAYMGLFQPYGVLADQVRTAYTRALELDENQVEALLAKALDFVISDYEFRKAEKLVQQALDATTDKTLVVDSYLAFYLWPQQRFDEALQHLVIAEREDPLSPLLKQGIGIVLYYQGSYEEAIKKLNEALELNPQDIAALWIGRVAYIELGRFIEAEKALNQLEAIIGRENGWWLDGNADLKLARGERDAAEAARQKMIALYESGQWSSATQIGGLSAVLGLLDEAITWFERAYEIREAHSILISVLNRGTPALWEHPRFQALLKKMNLDDASIAAMKAGD